MGEATTTGTGPVKWAADQYASRDMSRFLTLIRDGLLAGVAALLLWSVGELHSLSNRVTAIEANHLSIKDGVDAEHRFDTLIGVERTANEAALKEIRDKLSVIATDTAQIKGAMGAHDTRPAERAAR